MNAAGFPAALATCTLDAIAARSNADGRQRDEQEVCRSYNHVHAGGGLGRGINDHKRRLLLRGLLKEAFARGGNRFMNGGSLLSSGFRPGLRAP